MINFGIDCSDVVDGEEFASSNCQDVIRIISSDKLTVPSEEKVFPIPGEFPSIFCLKMSLFFRCTKLL